MKRKLLKITILILLHFAFSSDKKYNITNVNIIAQLNEDGSLDVVEERTYHFKGKFKFAYQNLKISDDIQYDNIFILSCFHVFLFSYFHIFIF